MSLTTLYAYVDGADLDDVADTLATRFAEFAATHHWAFGAASVVNHRHGEETCTQPDDIPLWDLGLTLPLPEPGTEPPNWFSDIEAVARFLGVLHTETGREFVIGIADTQRRITDDLLFVTSDTPDIQTLTTLIGASYERPTVA